MNLPALIRSVSPAIAAGIVVTLCGITASGAAQPAAAVPKLDAKYTNKPQGLVLRCFMDDSGDAATAALLDRVVQEVWFR
jgi:hypothetical protein